MNKPYQLIIFDWDGTLVDSIERIVTCFHKSFEAMNIDAPSDEAIKGTIGKPLVDAYDILVPSRPDDKETFIETYRDFWRDPAFPLSPLFEGVPAMLEQFADQGYTMAVATGKSREGLERELEVHDRAHHFATTRCAGETRSKPDPQMLQEILDQLKFSPKDALMIGDATLDLDMAHNLGMDSVAVTSGGSSREALLECKPLACLEVVTQLTEWLVSMEKTEAHAG